MRKQLTILGSVLALGAAIFYFNSQKIVRNNAYFEAVGKYVYAYTGGTISSTDVIRVRFVNPAVAKEQIGQPVEARLFEVSPDIKGKAIWEDDRTITLRPETALPYGKKYTAIVALNKIYPDVPKIAREFEFKFNVNTLAYEVELDGANADPDDLRYQRVSGTVRINEPCEAVKIEKMLTARQGNKPLEVSWNHYGDNRLHRWTVKGAERSHAESSVNLEWVGKAIGVDKTTKMEQVIPPFDDFIVLNSRVVQVEEQYVLINFSDPLAAGQDLSGLIRLEGYSGKLRFVTDGNFVRLYPDSRISGNYTLKVDPGIRNTANQSLKAAYSTQLQFEELNPGVRLVGRGAIIPQADNGSVVFPFEAVGLKAVDVEVFKIFNTNILQFLQVNDLEGERELRRVGKIILQKKINLSEVNPNANNKVWQRYGIDLREMIQKDPGAIYQVRLGFQKAYTDCLMNPGEPSIPYWQKIAEEGSDDDFISQSIMGGSSIYWPSHSYDGYGDGDDYYYDDYDENYDWEQRDEPCQLEYYNSEHFAKRNVFVSDIGMTAKRGRDGSLFLAVTDLHTAQPIQNVELELLTYQLQSISKIRTGADGTALVDGLRESPFVVVATNGNRRGYLRMADGATLSLSRFDVAGVEAQRGLKGYIYGERGVWRPGDSLFLNFVLEDKSGKFPANHPVTMELSDPMGSLQERMVQTNSVNGVYAFHTATRPEARTGNWTCTVKVGGAEFSKTLKIETVKPNRLKMDLDFGKKELSAADNNLNGKLNVKWLHGAVANGLKAKVELQMRAVKTEFKNYKNYVFDDPSRGFYSEPEVLFDANIDANGMATIPLKFGNMNEAPGKIIANFKVRAFENGGDFSTDNFALDVFPYNRFAGVYIPTDKWGSKTVSERGTGITFALVDQSGRPVPNKEVSVALYRVDWRWWWDEDAGVSNFNSSEVNNAIDQATMVTDARGQVQWKVQPNQWGRYYVRISDEEGGHSAGDFFWRGSPDRLEDMASRNAAAMLPFSVEKEKYNVGEEVVLKVPASENGRILLTLETGSRVAKHLWFEAKAGDNFLKFKAEAELAPTVYAHVSLMQPHAQTINDLPIRMYGVMPVNIENPNSRLEAGIEMPDVLRPDMPFNIAVRELGGKACVYTLAVVDEGLLDLTRFKTPNPWEVFYAREALGVKTWDIYDYVLGAYGSQLDRILAIGGDGINQKAKNNAQVNRFKPCVQHLGPFRLERGQTARHKLKIENYVGSVRVMVVMSATPSNNDGIGAYGFGEKTCAVRSPLMVLPTLPRVLGPGETLRLPVDVFAMEKSVQNATISVKEKSGLVSIGGNGQNTLNFAEPGQKMTYFDLKVGQNTGVAKFTVIAEGGGERASADIELLVRNPNPIITAVQEAVLEPGQTWNQAAQTGQFSDVEKAYLEVSSVPPINLSRQLEYLIQYPHGCVEQTTSGAFPQLYVEYIAPLSDKQKKEIEVNIKAAIAKLQNFQTTSGGFAYWPGGSEVNDWASTYAGHFLLEAKNMGYAVPQQMLDRWADHQANVARTWNESQDDGGWYYHGQQTTQAYRLFSLALAGKPDFAGMNRLMAIVSKYGSTLALLASSYAQSGKSEVAKDLLNELKIRPFTYGWWGDTYGTTLRDKAIRLEAETAIGSKKADDTAREICLELGKTGQWYNTQELAVCLRAISRYAKKASIGKTDFVVKAGGQENKVDNSAPYYIQQLSESSMKDVAVKNTSKQRLYTRLVLVGRPLPGDQSAEASNISMAIRYTDVKGQAIDPSKLTKGTDFMAEVTLTRKGNFSFNYNELALTQVFPSGWEIMNTRMNLVGGGTSDPMDYQDVRDDRVMTYFDFPYTQPKPNTNTTTSMTYRIQLNAAYAGRYYLPTVSCEAMYDNRIRATAPGKWVEVM